MVVRGWIYEHRFLESSTLTATWFSSHGIVMVGLVRAMSCRCGVEATLDLMVAQKLVEEIDSVEGEGGGQETATSGDTGGGLPGDDRPRASSNGATPSNSRLVRGAEGREVWILSDQAGTGDTILDGEGED